MGRMIDTLDSHEKFSHAVEEILKNHRRGDDILILRKGLLAAFKRLFNVADRYGLGVDDDVKRMLKLRFEKKIAKDKREPLPDLEWAIDAAFLWRAKNGYTDRGGVIVVSNGAVQGWVKQLPDPDHWQKGCFAVDEEGNCWRTRSNSTVEGKMIWEQIPIGALCMIMP